MGPRKVVLFLVGVYVNLTSEKWQDRFSVRTKRPFFLGFGIDLDKNAVGLHDKFQCILIVIKSSKFELQRNTIFTTM